MVVAFNAGNLRPVAEKMHQSLPANIPVIIAADNDVSQTGINKARAAAEVFGQRATVIMPEFTPEQILQHQQQSGQDSLPSDFNDLQQLAGLDAVRQAIGFTYQQKPEQTPEIITKPDLSQEIPPEWSNPQRTDWGDFPPIIRNGHLGELKNEPEYQAAKGGDVIAAGQLVNKLINQRTIAEIKQMIGEHRPYIVPVLAEEAAGKNKIPLAMANSFGQELGLSVNHTIKQANKVSRTGAGIDHRFAFQPTFTGEVVSGKEYLLMDDTLSVGSTIANLKGYIETHGGKVLGAAVMTAHEGSLNIVVKPTMIEAINRKHGDGMDKLWKEEFGYGMDKLTQGEAGHLRAAQNVDAIRTRITGARNEARSGMAATELPKRQLAQPTKEIIPEATETVASSLVEPPLQQPTPITAEPAVFLRPEQTNNMETEITNTESEITNSIELNERQEWKPEPDPFWEQQDESLSYSYADLYHKPYHAASKAEAEAKPELKPEPELTEDKPATASKKVSQHEDNPLPQTEPIKSSGNTPDAEQSGTNQPEPDQTTEPESAESEIRKPITDLHYDTPPHLSDRYIVADGQYLSAVNGTTVLFEDKGKKLTTAKTDMQTVKDMLDVAKAKNWDNIKLSGTPEFKAMMYVAAESQGIRTSGYKPTPADLAMVEKLRAKQSLNSIEAVPDKPELQPAPTQKPTASQSTEVPKTTGERIIAHGSQPFSEPRLFETRPARADPPDRTESTSEPPEPESQEDRTFNAAKDLYHQKAGKLSKDEKAKLMFYEQNAMNAIDCMPERFHKEAVQNFYDNIVKSIHGNKLDAPHPIQIPTPETKRTEPTPARTESVTQVTIDETEIDR